VTRAPRIAFAGDALAVRVTPRASAERLTLEEGPDGLVVRVWVTAPPEDGKANAAVLKLLAKALGLPKSALTVAQGAASRDKLIRIAR
jgi:uncharacterized protein YggU (UPF0235/DUF167 family)